MTPESKRDIKPLPGGAFEKVLLLVKEAFPGETLGVDDTSFWIEIENRANDSGLTLKQAAFQYYLRGVDHVHLAEMVIDYFPRIKVGVTLGEISEEARMNYISMMAGVIFEYYPPRYRQRYKDR